MTSDAGDEYQDALTDTAGGAVSNLFAVNVNNLDTALTAAQEAAILADFNVHAVDAGEVTAKVTTASDSQSRVVKVPAKIVSVEDLEQDAESTSQLAVGDKAWENDDNRAAYSVVSSIGDVLAAMKKAVAKSGKKLDVLEFEGHGDTSYINISFAGGNNSASDAANSINAENAKDIGQRLKESGLLAPNAIIILSGCDVGNSAKSNKNANPTWQQVLANSSGCTVYAAGGVDVGSIVGDDAHVFYDNLSELKNYPWWSTLFGHVGRKQLLQESPDAYGSEDGIFYEFDPR